MRNPRVFRKREEHCYRCGYVWEPRAGRSPSMCSKCKSRSFWFPKPTVPSYGGGLGIRELVAPKRREVLRLCHRYGAKEVRIFGSVARSEATDKSDIDILVDRRDRTTSRRVSSLRKYELSLALERALGRKVDVVVEDSVFWLIQPQILSEAVPL